MDGPAEGFYLGLRGVDVDIVAGHGEFHVLDLPVEFDKRGGDAVDAANVGDVGRELGQRGVVGLQDVDDESLDGCHTRTC